MKVFAATRMFKTARLTTKKKGPHGKEWAVHSSPIDLTAPTLKQLVKKITDHYALDPKALTVDEDPKGDVDGIGFTRLENFDGLPPDTYVLARWREGVTKLCLAEYLFHIEVRESVRQLTRKELRSVAPDR